MLRSLHPSPLRLRVTAISVAVAALSSSCVSLLTEGNSEENFAAAKRDHIYGFYLQQTNKLRDLGACREAAGYFDKTTNPKSSNNFGFSSRSSDLKDDDVTALQDRIVPDARALLEACEKDTLPKLEAARQWEKLATTMKALAILPIGEADQQALLRRADTVDLLRAKATADDGVKAYAAGDYYKALSDLSFATSIARGVKSATDAEKSVYAHLEQQHKDKYVALMVKSADDAARTPATAHRALIYLGRAYDVGRDKRLLARLDTARKELLASHVYGWKVDIKGEATIARTAQEAIKAHQFAGNYQPGVAREFVAALDVGAFSVTPTEKDGSRTGHYVTGSRSVDNPEYRKLQTYVNNQQRCLANLGTAVSYSSNQTFKDQSRIGCDYHCTSYDCARRENQARLNNALRKLEKTSMTLQEDITSPWQYKTREWSQVGKAPVQLSLKHALEAGPKSSTMSLEVSYADHAHGLVEKLGLGPKSIVKKSEQDLAKEAGAKLAGLIVAEIEKDYQAWLAALPQQGERGVVLYMVMNRDGQKLNAQVEGTTGVKDAFRLVNQR